MSITVTPEYLALVGLKDTTLRQQHPERLYFHSYRIDRRCRWCGRLPADGDKVCPTLVAANGAATTQAPPVAEPPLEPDYYPVPAGGVESAVTQPPVILVTGLGRCGTSALMRMLHVGGLAVLADETESYESDSATLERWTWPTEARRLADSIGRPVAVKVLDLHAGPTVALDGPVRVLRLSRTPIEQAKSMRRFIGHMGVNASGDADTKLVRSILRDIARLDAAIDAHGWPTLRLRFEDLLTKPLDVAFSIQAFLDQPLRVTKMAEAIRLRSPRASTGGRIG